MRLRSQEIESVIDEPRSALVVRRGLGLGEARQPRFVNAAEFAVEIGGPHVQVRERHRDALILVSPVESGVTRTVPRTAQLNADFIDHQIELKRSVLTSMRLTLRSDCGALWPVESNAIAFR